MIIKKHTDDKNLPFVSVIVLNWNGKKHLRDCFNSLKKIDYPKNKYEIIMADNASSDDSIEYTKKNFPFIKIVKFNKNYGFAEGNNKAVKYTNKKSEYIVFLNNDTKVDKRWLNELVIPLINNKEVVCSGAKLFRYSDHNFIDSAGDKITIIGTAYGIGHLKKDNKKYNQVKYASICGASMLIKKDIFKKLMGFDKDYFAYSEDVDLCWRLFLQGYKAVYVPTAKVYHKGGGSSGSSRNLPFRLYLGQKNRLCNMIKNLGGYNLIKGFIISLCYDIFRILKFLIKGEFKNILAILKGNYFFIKELRKTLGKRKKIQKNRKIKDIDLYKLGVFATLLDSINEEIYLSKKKQ